MYRIFRTNIFGMSQERAPFKKKMESWGELIEEHLSKCAMYGDTLSGGKYNHWIEDELATYLSDTNDATFKPKGSKLKPHDYESLLFGGLGDDRTDARICLHNLQAYNRKQKESYPYVTVDDDMIDKMYRASQAIINKFVPILSTKNSLSKKDIESILHNILDPICLK